MKKIYLLFETDIYKSKNSRIFLGVFTTSILAELHAKKNNCYRRNSTAVIQEIEINRFGEI